MKRLILAILILTAGLGFSTLLFKTQPQADLGLPAPPPTTVETLTAYPTDHTVSIASQGMVEPKTVTKLAAEVFGRVVFVSEKFRAGHSFEKGEVLLKIDPSDYITHLAQAEAGLVNAQLALDLEEARADQAKRDWEKLGRGEKATDLVLRKPQLAAARAKLAAAAAAVEKAESDLGRTEIRAPYPARVRATYTDLGSMAGVGTPLADIYALAPYEVRLPLSLVDASLVDLTPGAPVTFHTNIGGKSHRWEGKVLLREGEIDRASRSLYVVAEVSPKEGDYHLQPGLFLDAELASRPIPKAFRITRSALLNDSTILIVTTENLLEIRSVEVAHTDGRDALITGGIEPGERICTTFISSPIDGTEVQVHDGSPL